jgi:addiction module HigA family antidote
MAKQKTLAPWEVFKNLTEEYQLTLGQMASDLKISISMVRQILIGKSKISPHIAMRLAKYFNLTIDYWLNLQAQYDLAEAQKDPEFSTVLKSIPKAKKPKAGAKKPETEKTVKSPKGAAAKPSAKAPRGRKVKEEKLVKVSRTTAKPKATKPEQPSIDIAAKPTDKPKRGRKSAPKALKHEAPVDEAQVKKPNTILIKNPDNPVVIEKPEAEKPDEKDNGHIVSPQFNFGDLGGFSPTDGGDIKETDE